jgi:hypothetical protein
MHPKFTQMLLQKQHKHQSHCRQFPPGTTNPNSTKVCCSFTSSERLCYMYALISMHNMSQCVQVKGMNPQQPLERLTHAADQAPQSSRSALKQSIAPTADMHHSYVSNPMPSKKNMHMQIICKQAPHSVNQLATGTTNHTKGTALASNHGCSVIYAKTLATPADNNAMHRWHWACLLHNTAQQAAYAHHVNTANASLRSSCSNCHAQPYGSCCRHVQVIQITAACPASMVFNRRKYY